MSLLSIAGSTPSDEGFELKSGRFEDGASPSLSWTPSFASSVRTTWTISCWVKIGNIGTNKDIFSAGDGSSKEFSFGIGSANQLHCYNYTSGDNFRVLTTRVLRDPSAWYHILCKYDTIRDVPRVSLYINGELQTDLATNTQPSWGFAGDYWSYNGLHYISRYPLGAANYMDGYLAEAYSLAEHAVGPEYFGETNEFTNQWVPKNPADIKASVTFGENGFYLPFSNDALATSFSDSSVVTDALPNATFTPTTSITADILIVGGGGSGGGGDGGGGGGAGGFKYYSQRSLSATGYSVTVGKGGGSLTVATTAVDGDDSTFDTLTATGGGKGGSTGLTGFAGGSGGGGNGAATDNLAGGSGMANQGNDGGTSSYGFAASKKAGGGGGGASAVGGHGQNPAGTYGGPGGAGYTEGDTVYDWESGSGTVTFPSNFYNGSSNSAYAGGGGGGVYAFPNDGSKRGIGGVGGGGDGEYCTYPAWVSAQSGTSGTGGGGGGSGGTGQLGRGGSGIVIIRYQAASAQATGGTITTYGSGGSQYYVHTFINNTPKPVKYYADTKNERITKAPLGISGQTHIIGPPQSTSLLDFDGSGDYLQVPASADWNFGTGDFCIEFWANVKSGNGKLMSFGTHDATSSIALSANTANGNTGFDIRNDSNTNTNMAGSGVMSAGRWYHYAVCRDGSKFYMYVDGVFVTSGNNDPSGNYGASTNILYMAYITAGPAYGDQYMDGIRVSKGVARYPGGTTFTPPTEAFVSDANTVFLLQGGTDGTQTPTTDTGNTGHTITYNGDARWFAPKVGKGAAVFDGSGDYLYINDGEKANQDFRSGPWTAEAWWKPKDLSPNSQTIFAGRTDGYWGVIYNYDGNGKMLVALGDGYDWQIVWSGSAATKNNYVAHTWYHVALVYDEAYYRLYIDGVLDYTKQSTTSIGGKTGSPPPPADSGRGMNIGAWGNNSLVMNGFLDQVRTSKVARYKNGTTFSPPTTEFKDDKDTSLLLHMDGGGNIDPETNLPAATGEGKYFWDAATTSLFYDSEGLSTSKSAITFDGNGDYLAVPDNYNTVGNVDWDFGTGDYTIEGWFAFQPDANGDLDARFGMVGQCDNQTASNRAWQLVYESSKLSFYQFYSSGNSSNKCQYAWNAGTTSDSPGSNVWHHYVAEKKSNVGSLYIDGYQVTQASFNNSVNVSNAPVWIGREVNSSGTEYWYEGEMDQIRVSDNARYTPSSFVPATSAFTNDANTVLLMHMDGTNGGTTFTDSSTTPHTITAYGGANTSTAQKKFGTASCYMDGTGDYLTIPDSPDWNLDGDYTIEMWIRPAAVNAGTRFIMHQHQDSSYRWQLFQYNTYFQHQLYEGGFNVGVSSWTQGAIDPFVADTWYHIAACRQDGNIYIYQDGVQVGYDKTDMKCINSGTLYIGRHPDDTTADFNGYIDEIRISNIARYTARSFATPTEPFTTDVNTKLLVQSDFSEGGLGADHSNNYNYFTPANLGAHDSMLDSPMNNFCTLNPLYRNTGGASTLSEGNLKAVTPSGSLGDNGVVLGTIPVSSGKWYFEWWAGSANYLFVGISKTDWTANWAQINQGCRGFGNFDSGTLYGATSVPAGITFTTGDIVSVAVDMDNGKIWFGINGTFISSGDPAAGTNAQFTDLLSASDMGSSGMITPFFSDVNYGGTDTTILNCGQDSSFAGEKTSQGNQDGNNKGDFYYAPPSGYLALCTDNLSDPLISGVDAGTYHSTVLYTGNGATQSVTGAGFQPDIIWIKNTEITENNFFAASLDNSDGHKYLYTNLTSTEGDRADAVTSIDADGFSLGSWGNNNTVNDQHASWLWKAGGSTGATNNDGDLPDGNVTVSANTTAGFSIVKYTGTATSSVSGATVGHGLTQAPELIIVKDLNAGGSWFAGSDGAGWDYKLRLNSDDARVDDTTWNDTAPTASVFSIGAASVASNGTTYLGLCFHSVEGYCKIGHYEGNGNADGTFIYTGFKPAYVMSKGIDENSMYWMIRDNTRNPYNVVNKNLSANTNAANVDEDVMDFVSNGFKWRASASYNNKASNTYIYIAFAESPFKTSNAR